MPAIRRRDGRRAPRPLCKVCDERHSTRDTGGDRDRGLWQYSTYLSAVCSKNGKGLRGKEEGEEEDHRVRHWLRLFLIRVKQFLFSTVAALPFSLMGGFDSCLFSCERLR